jgi:hypothetical protein
MTTENENQKEIINHDRRDKLKKTARIALIQRKKQRRYKSRRDL